MQLLARLEYRVKFSVTMFPVAEGQNPTIQRGRSNCKAFYAAQMPGPRIELGTQGFSVLRSTTELPRHRHLRGDLRGIYPARLAARQAVWRDDLALLASREPSGSLSVTHN